VDWPDDAVCVALKEREHCDNGEEVRVRWQVPQELIDNRRPL
jgi:hypothetical protein